MRRLSKSLVRQNNITVLDGGVMVSLGVFVGQEIDRFNQLLAVMRKSLAELQNAIKGTVVMSLELEMMFTSFINKKVPLVRTNIF